MGDTVYKMGHVILNFVHHPGMASWLVHIAYRLGGCVMELALCNGFYMGFTRIHDWHWERRAHRDWGYIHCYGTSICVGWSSPLRIV